jgi:hypothetical protein
MVCAFCLSSPEGATVGFIPLNVNLEVLLILATFFALWLYFVEFYLYLLQGRWGSYVPTISKTGVEPFNNMFQARAFGSICPICLYSHLSIVIFTAGFDSHAGRRWATVLFLLGGLVATTGIGFADLKNHLIWHRIFGFFGLSFFNFYAGLTYVMYRPNMSCAGSIYRIAVIISASGNFIVAAFAEWMFSTRTCITLSTYGEYGLLLSLYAYILSYYGHLPNLHLDSLESPNSEKESSLSSIKKWSYRPRDSSGPVSPVVTELTDGRRCMIVFQISDKIRTISSRSSNEQTEAFARDM